MPPTAPGSALLDRVVAVDLRGATVRQGIDQLRDSTGIPFNFESQLLDTVSQRVSFRDSHTTLARALGYILRGTGLVALPYDSSIVVRVSQPSSIVGRIRDSQSGAPIAEATVEIHGLWQQALTSDSGAYRLDSVPTGTFTVVARVLGARPVARVVAITPGAMETVDLRLERAPNPLERVVVTGTVVPTVEAEIPTPISVITAADIEQRHYTRLEDIFRGEVPGSLAWDQGNFDYYSTITVRGINSFDINNIKTYIDGVEVANPSYASVDIQSIDRVEIIRGPEASTIYGSDASGGVMQIFTKHGSGAPDKPTVDATVAEGVAQNPSISAGALQQQYNASIEGSEGNASYNLGAAYRHVGAWIPGYHSSDPDAYGAVHIGHGALSIDLSGRYLQRDFPLVESPALVATGLPALSLPQNTTQDEREQTFGIRLGYSPTSWWQHNLVVGVDHAEFHAARTSPQQPDSSLELIDQTFGKASVAYNTWVSLPLTAAIHWTATAGFDHFDESVNEAEAANLASVLGFVSSNSAVLNRSPVSNTGFFGQFQVSAWDAFTLTAGLRADENNGIGRQYGAALAPRIGLTFVHSFGDITVKPRIALGDAIQPGTPDEQHGSSFGGVDQLSNGNLRPERQIGGDAGADIVFGRFGSFSVTYYDQQARDLIQNVPLNTASSPTTFQYQNVGRIDNRGVELEAAVTVGRLLLSAQFSYTSSRIAALGPNYAGDYRIGDQALAVPLTLGGVSAEVPLWRGGTLGAGLTYVGYWTNYNFVRYDSVLYGRATAKPLRSYWQRFPAFAKERLSVDQRIKSGLSAFVRVENLANNTAVEQDAEFATSGRTTVLGVRFRY